MKAGKPPLVCWDADVLIAHLQGEKRAPSEVEGLEAIVTKHSEGRVIIFASVIARAELWQTKLTHQQRELFDRLTQREDFVEVPVDRAVADLARELREGAGKLKTPDALHLATAILNEAKEFHTFDGFVLKLAGRKSLRALCGETEICKPGFGSLGKDTTRLMFSSQTGEPRCNTAPPDETVQAAVSPGKLKESEPAPATTPMPSGPARVAEPEA